MKNLKDQVQDHWEEETCGTRYASPDDRVTFFTKVFDSRYERTSYLREFAGFDETKNSRILEIGVGAGSDFNSWLENGTNQVSGVDLTARAIDLTREHCQIRNVPPNKFDLRQADAENLPFEDNTFDIVYSYGVLHHTPNTEAAFREVYRILKPGGQVRAMIYHVPSWTGIMLWVRHGLMKFKPWLSQKKAIFDHLESPGTKAYTDDEAREFLSNIGFNVRYIDSKLCPGDRLDHKPSEKYQGAFYKLVWKIYPRWLVSFLGHRLGLNLLIKADKPT